MRDLNEMQRFWNLLPRLEKNEVYVLLLIMSGERRRILDTVLLKNNDFEEFANKVALMLNKVKRLPFTTEVLIDVNKKNVVEGLHKGWREIGNKLKNNKDVRNFFAIFVKNIRHSQVTNYTMLKSNELILEMNPLYVVEHNSTYYHVFDFECEGCISKPELPIPGTLLNGKMVKLVYPSEKNIYNE